MKNRDTLSSLVMVLLAFWVCYFSERLSLWKPEGPSDGFFPFVAGLILGILALCLFVQSLFKAKKTGEVREPILKVKLLTYIGSSLVYPFVFELLGFVLSTFFFLLVISKGAEKASWKSCLIISGLSTISCFLIFYYIFQVPFPFGVLKGVTPLR